MTKAQRSIINSKNVRQVGIRAGAPTTNIVNPGGAALLGTHVGKPAAAPALYRSAAREQPLGNQLVKNIGAGGPGAGRVVHRCGSQGSAPVQPMSVGRNTLLEFGPDQPGKGRSK
jgi:hypothetical protein